MGASLLGLILLTVPFWVWPLDVGIQSLAWSDGAGWGAGDREPWHFLYHYGTWPAVAVALAGLVVLGLGAGGGSWARWRKVAAYLVLCMVIGPGLVVNLGLKDHWGRPRPRDVIPFGGIYPPETVWTIDPASPGKSFPCGHCTMGFYFLALGLVLWRQGKRRRAAWVYAGAVAGGLLLGTARMLQGGHFASDVLWGAGICWLVSLGLFYALGLDRKLEGDPGRLRGWAPGPASLVAAAVGIALVAALLLATPYRRDDTRRFTVEGGDRLELSLILEGQRHDVSVVAGTRGSVRATGQGHGLPGSAVKAVWKDFAEGDDVRYVQFKQRVSGWFTELDHRNVIEVPAGVPGEVRLTVRSGTARIDLGGVVARQEWQIEIEPGAEVRWRDGKRDGTLPPGRDVLLVAPAN